MAGRKWRGGYAVIIQYSTLNIEDEDEDEDEG